MSNGNGNASISAAGFYADFGALTALKRDVKSGSDPQAIRAAAQQFESLFTDMMLKAMRAAKLGDGLGDSQQSDLYQDMYDEQLALQMSHGKGLGLADLLVQQLTRGHGTNAATAASSSAEATGGPRATSPSRTTTSAATSAGSSAAGSAAAPGGAASHARRISFLQMLEPYARRAGAALGVSPDSLIAQAALETGWGQHVPTAPDTGSSHNLWGVKAGTAWLGQALQRVTTEYRQGSALSEAQSFRAYGSLQQGVNDYVSLLQRNAAYHGALGTGNDVNAFAQALQRGGYATDPHYADKLVSAAEEVRALRAVEFKLSAALPITAGVDLAHGADGAAI